MSGGLPPEGRFGPAPLERRRLPVIGRREIGPYVVVDIQDDSGARPAPGQFYMLSLAEGWGGGVDDRPYLPRAISVMEASGERLSFMLEAVGPGSTELCGAVAGDELMVLGPLGRGFRPAGEAPPVICAGGIGVAPMVMLAVALGGDATCALGFRDEPHAQAASLLAGAQVATDDGSAGHHGNAVELLSSILEEQPGAMVYSCGPPGMLAAVRDLCLERGSGAQLALESGMACGFGACHGCVVSAAGGSFIRLCVEGPVVAGVELHDDWRVAYG